MTTVTVELPYDLAQRLQPLSNRLPDILEMGLRQWQAAGQSGFQGTAEILELLATLPSPEEILALRPSDAFQSPKNKNGSSMNIWNIWCVWQNPEL